MALGSPPVSASAATSTTIDFTSSGYTVGYHSPATQNGWWLAKAADFSLVDNTSFPASGLPAGGRSLQFSNSTQPSGGAHLVSPTIEPAGEPATGATANTFEVSFTVASATGAAQPGLGVDVALDGASRFGGVVNMRHSADALEIGSYWYPADGVDGSVSSWRSAVFARVDPAVPHTIRAVAVFLEGTPDTFDVYVDGILVSAGSGASTWEAYSGSDGDRSVDGISFKASSSAPTADGIGYQAGLPVAAATAGKGLLFSGISYGVSTTAPTPPPTSPPTTPTPPKPAPAPTPSPTTEPTAEPTAPLTVEQISEQFGGDTAALLETYLRETGREVPPSLDELFTTEVDIDLSDFTAWLSWTGDETVKLYGYSTPTYLGTFPVVDGRAQISGVDLTALGEGEHHLLIVGGQSGSFQVAGLEIAAPPPVEEAAPAPAAETPTADAGPSPWVLGGLAAALLAALVVTAVLVRRRFA